MKFKLNKLNAQGLEIEGVEIEGNVVELIKARAEMRTASLEMSKLGMEQIERIGKGLLKFSAAARKEANSWDSRIRASKYMTRVFKD